MTKLDRRGQVWEINVSESYSDYVNGVASDSWKTFTVIETSNAEYETVSGTQRKFVVHRCVVSDRGDVVNLNEDTSIPWEDCRSEYRRIV